MENVIQGKRRRSFTGFTLAIGTGVIAVPGYLIFGPNCKVQIDGEHLSDAHPPNCAEIVIHPLPF